jgi:hypothetical protein
MTSLTFACLMNTTEMPAVGFAIVNPGKQNADATLTLYSPVGQATGKSTASIPAGGQFFKRANQLFPNAATGGWVQLTSDVTGLRGFWMTGDAGTVGDNAEAETSDTELVLPLVTVTSEIVIVNPGSRDTSVRIKLYSVNGQEVAEPAVRVLPPKGAFRAPATTLFSPLDWSSVTHAKISSGMPVVAAAQVRDFRVSPSLSLVNAVSVSSRAPTFAFPHVLQGPVGDSRYITTLGITNVSSSPQTMTFAFYPADGSPPQTVQQAFPANGAVRASARTIFGFGDEFRSGWVSVTAPRGAIGFASNADIEQGGSTLSPSMARPQLNFIFGYIAAAPPWWTGLTLVNPGTTAASVDIFAIAPDGSLIGGAQDSPAAHFVISPNGKISRLLNEWITTTQSRSSDGGFVYVRSSAPLYGLGLLFTQDRRILSVIPGFDLAAGAYDPPQSGSKP